MDQFLTVLFAVLQKVLEAVLPVLAVALTGWLLQKIREIGKGIDEHTMQTIQWVVEIAVNAAEQAGAAQLIDDKKQYAIGLAQAYLDKQNIKIDLALLEGLIEAAVLTQINNTPQLPDDSGS